MLFIEEEKSVGIQIIKELGAGFLQKPYEAPYKVIVFLNAETLTAEAQNALLKSLEEPPPNTQLILVANKQEGLLPTILSRCVVHILAHTKNDVVETALFETFCALPLKDKLLEIEKTGTDRQKARQWCTELLLSAKKQLEQTPKTSTLAAVQLIAKTLDRLEKNVNVHLALESLALHLEM